MKHFTEQTRFNLTEDHIKLLRRANVGWQRCAFGAPEIDPKRPYGNSFVEGDIAEILGVELVEDDDGDFDQATCEQLEAIHKQTHVALEIILATGTFTPGEYVRYDIYTTDWKLVRHADAPEPASMVAIQRDTAIRHLHTLLNSQRSATQSWKDEDAAREWLRSIGSEAP